jgi:hypothetical protein
LLIVPSMNLAILLPLPRGKVAVRQ